MSLQKLGWNMKNKRTNASKYMDVIKIFLTLSGFVTPWLWLLTLKDCLRARLLRLTTTDSQARLNNWRLLTILRTDLLENLQLTGLLTLQEQSDLPTLSGLVWWLILFTIWTFRLRTLQEFIDLMIFNGSTC